MNPGVTTVRVCDFAAPTTPTSTHIRTHARTHDAGSLKLPHRDAQLVELLHEASHAFVGLLPEQGMQTRCRLLTPFNNLSLLICSFFKKK